MDFFDIIKELRKGDPDIHKAGKGMKVLGWLCVAGSIWNFAIFYLLPFDESPFNFPPNYPYIALISLLFLGGLFLFSSQGIKKMEPIGKRIGQIAIILLLVLFTGFMFSMIFMNIVPEVEGGSSVFFILFSVICFAQFGIPAYYGVLYLGRLSVKEVNLEESRFQPESVVRGMTDEKTSEELITETKYKEALFPFGILGTFALLIGIPLAFFAIERFSESNQIFPLMFIPVFLFIFLAPVVYNNIPSSFQKERHPIESFTGGGSIFLFNGSWPFFRLIVYYDGLEIRVMFHRFFIPYDKMEDIPEKVGFFNRGLLIKSNLPKVPSGIRYQGFGTKKIVEIVTQNRNRFLKIRN